MQVNIEHRDSVALIQFDDGKKNAITPEAAAQILAGIEEAVVAAATNCRSGGDGDAERRDLECSMGGP